MKEISREERHKYPRFVQSFYNHQELVNILISHRNVDGICEISDEELLTATKRTKGWVKRAIDRINTEDLCVEYIGRNRYVVHYDDLTTRGVFWTIIVMVACTLEDNSIARLKNEELAQRFDCTLRTVRMYRAYIYAK